MGGGFVVNEMGAVQTKENSMRGGFVVVYVVNEMGVIQTKEKRRASAASALTPAAVLSIANTAPVPPAAPPYAAVELADSAKRDGDVVADTAATGGVDAVLEGFLGSEGGGGGGEDERDRSGHEVEVAGEDEGGRSVSSEEGKEAEVEAVPGGKRERKAKVRPLYRRRPGQLVCTFFVQSGYCKFGADCKFNHPPNRRGRKEKCKKQHDALQVAEKEKDVSQQGVALAEYEKVDEMIGNSKERDKRIKYPQRPDATDCSFYMKTGACKFGSACRFNHPSERKNNKANVEKESVPFQDVKEKFKDKPPKSFGQKEKDVKGEASPKSFGQMRKDVKEKLKEAPFKSFGQKEKGAKEKLEASPKSFGQTEKDVKEKLKGTLPKSFGQKGKDVKFKEALPKSSVQKEKSYTTPGSRNISKQSNHQGVKESSSVAMNFLNLPIRPGAKECSHYMREGSCKFGINCKHHHPEPTATNASDLPSEYKDGQSTQQFGFGVSPLPGTPWHASTSYTKAMHLPYGLYPNPEWNRYQVPMLQPEMHTRNTSASPVNHADNKANILLHQQAHIEYPQRPGQPECHYFKKTGVCKIGSACKFHHPKDQLGINANSNSEPKQICEFTHQL